MPEYIEREALLLRIDCHGTNKFGMLDEDIRAFVKAQPAINVAPVAHGHWKRYSTTMMVCSICEKHVAWHRYNYCPNCGAKMGMGDTNEAD